MIKYESLRKGNFVMDRNGNMLRIGWFEKNTVCQSIEGLLPVTEEIDQLQPIPFSVELLQYFGFKFEPDSSQIDGVRGTFIINGNGVDATLFSTCGNNNGGINYFGNNLEYVHEMQNLFYDLSSGQEMKITIWAEFTFENFSSPNARKHN